MMLKITGVDFVDNYLFNTLRDKWPQINDKTSVMEARKGVDIWVVRDTKTTRCLPNEYDEMEPGIKNAIKRAFAGLTGNEKMFRKTMRLKPPVQCMEQREIPFEFIFFIDNGVRLFEGSFAYIVERDVLMTQIKFLRVV